MITNERQYRITRGWLERFERARAGVEGQGAGLHPRARQALRDQYDSQIEELRAQLAEYEALRRGEVDVLELQSLRDLPAALIRARVAAGLTQAALARRLGLKKQQVQRYEATRYTGVTLERIETVADALGVTIRQQVVLPAAPLPEARERTVPETEPPPTRATDAAPAGVDLPANPDRRAWIEAVSRVYNEGPARVRRLGGQAIGAFGRGDSEGWDDKLTRLRAVA